MKKITKGNVIFAVLASILCFYVVNRAASLFYIEQQVTQNVLDALSMTIDGLWAAIAARPFWMDTTQLHIGMVGVIMFFLFWIYSLTNNKNFRPGEEHGSARWGTNADLKHLYDHKNQDNNIILAQNVYLRFSGPVDFRFDRNKNVVVIGGSGGGKTAGYAGPNLMQLHSSYVVTDPKGTILPEMGHVFESAGYEIRVLNTINFKKSMHYNPLAYIRSEKDILQVVDVLIRNTSGEGEQSKEDFWIKSERLIYSALIGYLYYEAPLIDRNIPMLSDMIDQCRASEEDENYKSTIDILFEELERCKGSSHFAVKQYKKFKQAAGKTLKSILISCAARLAPFDIQEVRELMMDDELQLDQIGDRKTAFFVIMSDTSRTFSFINAMMFYQMFNLLCTHADDECGGKLPVPVRCILDEFANIGRIPDFEVLISTIRSRQISASIILQSKTQLTNTYKDNAETIIDCCDSYVFLGGKSTKTVEDLSKMLGKETIDMRNMSQTKGQQGSVSVQNQITGRDLLDPAEIGKIDRTECIVQITGLPPFRCQKYDFTKHKRYKLTGRANPKYMYDIEKAISEFRTRGSESSGRKSEDEHLKIDVSELMDL